MYVCEGGHFWPSLCEALVVVVVAAPVLGNPGDSSESGDFGEPGESGDTTGHNSMKLWWWWLRQFWGILVTTRSSSGSAPG